jgi:hypothetical protein
MAPFDQNTKSKNYVAKNDFCLITFCEKKVTAPFFLGKTKNKELIINKYNFRTLLQLF